MSLLRDYGPVSVVRFVIEDSGGGCDCKAPAALPPSLPSPHPLPPLPPSVCVSVPLSLSFALSLLRSPHSPRSPRSLAPPLARSLTRSLPPSLPLLARSLVPLPRSTPSLHSLAPSLPPLAPSRDTPIQPGRHSRAHTPPKPTPTSPVITCAAEKCFYCTVMNGRITRPSRPRPCSAPIASRRRRGHVARAGAGRPPPAPRPRSRPPLRTLSRIGHPPTHPPTHPQARAHTHTRCLESDSRRNPQPPPPPRPAPPPCLARLGGRRQVRGVTVEPVLAAAVYSGLCKTHKQ